MNRRDFAARTSAGLAAATALPVSWRDQAPAFPLAELTIAQLSEMLADRRTTTRRLVEQYSERIRWLDETGPRIGHVLELNPEARTLADQLDTERRNRRLKGPLHGIPVLIKDNIATGDRMETTAGSLALLGQKPTRDAFIAQKLRDAGALILGKTNLSEWANYRSTRSVSGWSGRGGQCRNPYALDRSPSGSSSGSAVAAAASSCAATIGTETNGSIISPASSCGIVGFKPTVGLVSRSGIIPIAASHDTAGPMTRTVADAAMLLSVIAGTDPADPATAEADRFTSDFTRLDAQALRGQRIGVLRPAMAPKIEAVYNAAIAVLRELGAELVDPVTIPPAQLGNAVGLVFSYEFKAGIEQYLAEWTPGGPMRTLADLVSFNTREAARELPYFAQEIFDTAATRGPLTTQEYVDAQARVKRSSGPEGIDRLLTEQRLAAIVGPSRGPAGLIDLVNGDGGGGGPVTYGTSALAGYPSLTVPMGIIHGLPLGLGFYGEKWSDARILNFGYAYEQASRQRRAPEFLASADIPWSGRPREAR
jgi:amidase